MQNVSKDTSKLLTEKLALVRELSTLKPELEFLKAQAAQHQGLLAEKLEMQRELVTMRVELENEKKSNQRLMNRQARASEADSSVMKEIEELRKSLQREKREREKADNAVELAREELENEKKAAKKAAAKGKKDNLQSQELEELRNQLEEEQRQRKESERAASIALADLEAERKVAQKASTKESKGTKKEIAKFEAQISTLQEQLETERKARRDAEEQSKRTEKASKSSGDDDTKHDELLQQISEEVKARQKAEKELQRSQRETKDLLSLKDEKVQQFREKLKSVKEERDALKEQLANSAVAAPAVLKGRVINEKLNANPRKRAATVEKDETALGTPGMAHAAKRNRRSQSTIPGDKSTFSITPFLNKTANFETSSQENGSDDDRAESEEEQTPTAKQSKPAKKTLSKMKPLAKSGAGKSNAKAGPLRKKSALSTLDAVAEGNEENEVQEVKTTTSVPLKDPSTDAPVLKPKSTSNKNKPRKSLLDFESFRNDPDDRKDAKKKRKLGGGIGASGIGKTLFDDEEEAPPPKAIPGKNMFAARSLGMGVLGAKGGPAIKGGFKFNSEGFEFSPLKKDRKKKALF